MESSDHYMSTIKGIPLTVEGLERLTFQAMTEGLRVAAILVARIEPDDGEDFEAYRGRLVQAFQSAAPITFAFPAQTQEQDNAN